MKMLQNPQQTDRCVLVLGMFDGVHRGHQALLTTGRQLADILAIPLTVCTFEPHPLAVLCPDKAPKRLTTVAERAQLMAQCGVDVLSTHPFTKALADEAPEAFLQRILDIYRPMVVICGYNFTFGQGGRGNGELLQAWGKQHNIRVDVIPEVTLLGGTVSSTRVREELEAGRMKEANVLLGHAWTLSGPVVHGRGDGHKLGFPTANVQPPEDKQLPLNGVYVAFLETAGGQQYHAMVNVGRHPTFPVGGPTVEANILEEDQPDLYGQRVRLRFYDRLRGEQAFPDAEALERQLWMDRARALEWFDTVAHMED